MTPEQTNLVVSAMFGEYCALTQSKGIAPEAAAKRIGVSRARYYQLKKKGVGMSLSTFLTLMDEVNKLKAAKETAAVEAAP